GNYQYYLENKDNRITNQNIEIDKTRKHLKKELDWVRRQPQGRQGKAVARVDAYYETKQQLGKKQLEENVELSSNFTRMGTKVLRFINVSKAFGNKKILNKFTYDFIKGEKIGIIGPNGVGKSTFLNLILGNLEPDSGKIVIGDTVKFGYYSQYQTELNPSLRVIEAIKEIAFNIKLDDGSELSASKMLERFLFSPKEQQSEISKLSGGEKKRIALLRILMTNPNFLILDEPTNDFDLMTLEVLETFLRNFKGCLIIISHDRHFMDSLVDHTFVFKGNGEVKDFPGNYTDYRKSIETDGPKPTQKPNRPSTIDSDKNTTEATNSTQALAKELYREIQTLEKTRDRLKKKLFQEGIDFMELGKISKEIEKLETEIEQKNEQWLEMSL
ncbi:MAG: ATP-binding cassette domain-containing protein, partial [archaeon]